MRLLGHIVFIICLSVLVESSDVVCGPTKTKKNVKLDLGDSYSFRTQEGDEYGKNVKCIAIFKRKNGADCNLHFSCDSFDITNAKPATCKRGDFFLINGEKFCEDNAPDITVDSAKLKVMFKSHKKIGGGAGADCNIQCLAPTTTETPTGAPSTPTTSPGSSTPTTTTTTATTTTTTTTECCKTIHTGREPYVFHQTHTHNKRPVYKHEDIGEGEICIHYKEQWMITSCEVFYENKTENIRGLPLLSKTNVDCPHQVEVGDWYEGAPPDHREAEALSFSCGSKYTKCCKYLRHDNVVFRQAPDLFNNRPSYYGSDEKRKYCIFYYRKQWIVTNCRAFYDLNSNKEVEFFSRANVDCPNQIVGDMYWYTPDGKQTNVSYSCTEPPKLAKPVKPLSKSLRDVPRPFGGY